MVKNVFNKANNRIHLTVKSVTFFAMQKNRPFLRQVMRALDIKYIFMTRVVGIVFSLLYSINAFLGAVAGTCTMGDDDRFSTSVFTSVPILLIVGYCLWTTQKLKGQSVYALFIVIIASVSVLYNWFPILWNTSIMGNHLCGKDYNSYITGSYVFEKYIPIIHFTFAGLLLVLSSYPILKEVLKWKNV